MKTLKTLALILVTTLTMAQTNKENTVDVTGEGIVTIIPDEVTVKVRVENTGKDPKVLKQQNDRTVSEVLTTAKNMGVADKYISTDYVRLSKNYEYNTKTYNFVANQSISIKLVDLSKYEAVMNALLNSGINRIDGVQFSSSEKESLLSDARVKAVKNAKMKAQEYAGALNQTIGKAVSISEFKQSNNPGPVMYRSANMMEADSGAGGQTLAPGEMEIKTTVQVSFVLN